MSEDITLQFAEGTSTATPSSSVPLVVGTATNSTHAINQTYLSSIGSGQKNNVSASVAPATTDDGPDGGYSVGSFWYDTTADIAYVCLDSTNDAAVWKRIDNFKFNSTTSNPTTTDDASAGYEVGSLWVNTTSDSSFICVDSTTSSAVWNNITNPLTTTGDLIYSASGATPSRLAIGSSGEVLTVSGGVPTWQASTSPTPADTSKTGNYTATTADEFIRCDASGGDFTITLYTAASNAGKTLKILNVGSSGLVTIDGDGSETIGGSSQKYISAGQSVYIEADGTNWQIVSYTRLTGHLKDVKANATQGGTFTSGAWQTRTLNTTEGDFTKFGSLSSNQFTLSAGTYIIDAIAPAFNTNAHKAKIYNITDTTDDIIGSSSYMTSTSNVVTHAPVLGQITITSSKTFELQHRAGATRATDGFGVANNFSTNEIYSIVKIVKIV